MDEMVYATYSMVASENVWQFLEAGVQPFAPLVQDHVLREMRRHSSFGKHRLRYRREEFPIDGFMVIKWEAVEL